MSNESYLKSVIEKEAQAVFELSEQVGPNFDAAIQLIENSSGKVVITGVGKSGHIGKKIAATFASTGTPAFFVHSTEGVHGDLGMIEECDVVILISNSGETAEVLSLLPSIKTIGARCISITKNAESTLASSSDVALTYSYSEEADHLGLAPTTSSTLTLVIGDALACTLSKNKDFKKENFHVFHPGGSLGKQLETND
ncbi:KpsF/GutQ family sugar-phosphate isomerase [Virgibacillus sp. W0181]|uniref:KpsF/GutQ family sugar-phosphate isomerase n=1 Tax=Virgibacillus sp. W0181 TaxID=3391581 RepID=UPI003F47C3AD